MDTTTTTTPVDSTITPTENTSNVIIMTPEMIFMKTQIQKNNELQNTINLQSAEIGRLLSEVQLWKTKYEEVFSKII